MVRVGGSQGMPQPYAGQNQMNQMNQMNQLGQFGGTTPYGGFPGGLASLAGFNPAAFLQQSKSLLKSESISSFQKFCQNSPSNPYAQSIAMEMGNIMGGFMGMAGMNMGNMGVNPFVQLLNQSGLPPNWAAGLSGMCLHRACWKVMYRARYIFLQCCNFFFFFLSILY